MEKRRRPFNIKVANQYERQMEKVGSDLYTTEKREASGSHERSNVNLSKEKRTEFDVKSSIFNLPSENDRNSPRTPRAEREPNS